MFWRWLLLFLFLPSVLAQPVNDFNDVADMDISFILSSNIDLVPTGSQAEIEFVSANVSFFPRDHLWQRVTAISADAGATIQASDLDYTFFWDSPSFDENMAFSISADLHNTNVLHLVEERVPFPLTVSDPYFTQQTEFIDLTPDIEKQALALAAGKDDLYAITFDVANWVEQNVAYDLSTMTAEVVQPSSWVLANRQGVCDELTNLFISMMRSLDVPTRYVSGLAYTNTLHDWGPHAWAEVYFPNIGWVPFDVTYGQFGWIDPSHIKLRESIDSGDATIKYLWRSNQVDFLPREIGLRAALLSSQGQVQPLVNLTLIPLVERAGAGSYVPFSVHVVNNQNYYLPLSLYVTKAQRLTEENVQRILLPPLGSKDVFWMMRVPDTLDVGYLYSTVIEVQDTFHTIVQSNISYSAPYKSYDLSMAQELIEEEIVADARVVSEALLLQCSGEEYMYTFEEIPLSCTLKNVGTSSLDVSLCAEGICQELLLDPALLQTTSLILPPESVGTHTVLVAVTGDVVVKEFVVFTVLADPGIRLVDIDVPSSLRFSESSNISFTLSAQRPVEHLFGFFNNQPLLELERLDDSRRVTFAAQGKQLYLSNGVNITLYFEDASGKPSMFSKQFPVSVVAVPWYMKVVRVLLYLF